MVLLGICDARYCFSYVDVGEYGSNNESGVPKNSRMGRKFGANKMNIPSPAKILESDDLESRITLHSSWRRDIPSFKLVNETLFWKSLNI